MLLYYLYVSILVPDGISFQELNMFLIVGLNQVITNYTTVHITITGIPVYQVYWYGIKVNPKK